MICLVGNLPVLQVGRHQVVGYGTEWIDLALERAAKDANRDDFPFIDDIRDGVLHYLENRCPLRVLPLEDLYARMRRMLHKIGCPAIARHLKQLSPPVTVSLTKAAHDAGNGYELVFFCLLTEDLNHLSEHGAECIRFKDIEETAMILRGKESYTDDCVNLASDIEGFLERYADENKVPERPITLTVEP